MGTNFYIRQKIKDEDKKAIQDLLEANNMDSIKDYASEHNNCIHIGKQSFGWKFLWNANLFKHFKPSIKSLYSFLKSGDIYDEYNNKYTFEDFINHITINKGYDLESYYASNKNIQKMYPGYNELTYFEKTTNITPNIYGEFYIENHRFTISEYFA